MRYVLMLTPFGATTLWRHMAHAIMLSPWRRPHLAVIGTSSKASLEMSATGYRCWWRAFSGEITDADELDTKSLCRFE